MSESLSNVLFDDYKKVISWAVMLTLALAVMSMASCAKKLSVSNNNTKVAELTLKQDALIKLSEMGYNPILVSCAVSGWKNSKSRTRVCTEAIRANPESMKDLLERTKIITGDIN